MPKDTVRTDLALVRRALDSLASNGHHITRTATELGLSRRTVQRWYHRSLREPTGWPTDQDITEWRQWATDTAATRKRQQNKLRKYRNRKYLAGGQPLMVPAIGITRRVRALMAIGYTGADIAAHLPGSSPGAVVKWSGNSQRPERVNTLFFEQYAEMYRRLHMKVPNHRPAWVHARQRRWAADRGWAPPLAWDTDEQMDDPDATPAWGHRDTAA